MKKLDVLIATHGHDGLKMVEKMNLPQVEGVTYIVTWQQPQGDYSGSPLSLRPDVEIHPSQTIGLSRNRNLGISLAKAPVCLIADNDITYTPGQLQAVIDTFDNHPDVGLATFKYIGARKQYPPGECDLSASLPKNYIFASIEIAFRREAIAGIRFDERFGLGADYGHGEEVKFMHDCRMAGVNCRFFPIEITRHDGEPTGSRPITDPRAAQGSGAIIRHVYGFALGLPRVLLFVYRNWCSGRLRFMFGFKNALKGFIQYHSK